MMVPYMRKTSIIMIPIIANSAFMLNYGIKFNNFDWILSVSNFRACHHDDHIIAKAAITMAFMSA